MFIIVSVTALFFIALGSACLFAPSKASNFLRGFAGSASKHYAELATRLIVGGGFVLQAPAMLFPVVFKIFGWVLLVTTAVMLLIPWRLHRRFAENSVPKALGYLPLIGISAIVFGALILTALVAGKNIAVT